MLKSVSQLKDLTIHAVDGVVGSIEEFYFDDAKWTIRYLIVNTGSWLLRKQVLISPIFVTGVDWEAKQLRLSLTTKQIEDSPDIDTQKPVSRQHEAEYLGAMGASYYWSGPDMWGLGPYPGALVGPVMALDAIRLAAAKESSDSHLRSVKEVKGYHVEATDGEIGHVQDFIVDEQSWTIRYLEVATRNWWPGKVVLLAPNWVRTISWEDLAVTVGVARQAIQDAPDYVQAVPITRDYEKELHDHYGLPTYWQAL